MTRTFPRNAAFLLAWLVALLAGGIKGAGAQEIKLKLSHFAPTALTGKLLETLRAAPVGKRKLTWRGLLAALEETVRTTANVFVIGGMARDVPLAPMYRGITPFLAMQIILLLLLTLWPGMALLLPGSMK